MRYFYFFLFSLLVHLLLVSILDNLSGQPESKKVAVEIVYPETDAKDQKTLVRETETKDKKEADEKKKARFLSERTKRFQEEMRVKNSGLTQNPGGGKPADRQREKEEPGPGQVAKQFAPPLPSPFSNLGPGRGTARGAVGEKLPDDVKFGDFNALNTDRYLYYTFFARIEERIRPRWESSVRDFLEQLNPSVVRRREWLTQIEVLLDKNGHFKRVILHKKSGLDGLDSAAIEAFKAGSPYQNPPQEMVQDDGRIHLYYSITVSSAF